VTPLVIPRWKVDELDVILRDVTSGSNDPSPEPDGTSATHPIVEPEPFIETMAAAQPAPLAMTAEPQPTFEDVVSQVLAPPQDSVTPSVPPAGDVDDAASDVSSDLVWPKDSPLREIPRLSWPSTTDQTPAPDGSVGGFGLPKVPAIASSPGPLQSAVVIEERANWSGSTAGESVAVADPMPPVTPVVGPGVESAILITPLEGALDQPEWVPARAAKRKQKTRRRLPVHTARAMVLLVLLATAVALVLAQSAGAIHLGFLGPSA
jgi:hypothetical protein